MKKKKTYWIQLVLYLLIGVFIILGPFYFINYKPKDNTDIKINEDKNHWKGVITLWDYPHYDSSNGTQYSWIYSKIKQFERDNSGVFIELKPLDNETGVIELETAIKTKTYPDIAPIDYWMIVQGVLEPLDSYLSRGEINKYNDSAISAVQYHGRIWGVPCMMTTYTMLLNTDLFNEKGVELPRNGRWTYDEFVEKLKQLTYDKDGDGNNDVYGFHSFIDSNDYNLWGILLSDGAEIFDGKGNYCFNNKKAINGLKKLADLKFLHKVTPVDFGEVSEKDAWESFYKEKKIAVFPAEAGAVVFLDNLKKQGKGFEFAIADYPIGEKGMPVSMGKKVFSYGIFKQNDKNKLEMCMKFLKYIIDDESQEELCNLGVFPVKKNKETIYTKNTFMRKIEENLANVYNIPCHPYWFEMEEIIQSQIRQVLLNKKTPNKALKDAEMKIQMYIRTVGENNEVKERF